MIHHHLHAPSQPSQWASSELLQSQNLLIYQFHPDHHLVQDLIGRELRQHLVWKKKKKNWQYQDNRWIIIIKKRGKSIIICCYISCQENPLMILNLTTLSSRIFFFDKKRILHWMRNFDFYLLYYFDLRHFVI
jgi:hypothetical protein